MTLKPQEAMIVFFILITIFSASATSTSYEKTFPDIIDSDQRHYFVFRSMNMDSFSHFFPSTQGNPPIFSPLAKLSPNNEGVAQATVPEFQVCSEKTQIENKLTIIEAQPGGYSITTFPSGVIATGRTFDGITPEEHFYISSYDMLDETEFSPSDFDSTLTRVILSVTMLEESSFDHIVCSLRIRFKGRIYVYFNEILAGYGNSLHMDQEEILVLDNSFKFQFDLSYMLAIYGQSAYIFDVAVFMCFDPEYNLINPQKVKLTTYAPIALIETITDGTIGGSACEILGCLEGVGESCALCKLTEGYCSDFYQSCTNIGNPFFQSVVYDSELSCHLFSLTLNKYTINYFESTGALYSLELDGTLGSNDNLLLVVYGGAALLNQVIVPLNFSGPMEFVFIEDNHFSFTPYSEHEPVSVFILEPYSEVTLPTPFKYAQFTNKPSPADAAQSFFDVLLQRPLRTMEKKWYMFTGYFIPGSDDNNLLTFTIPSTKAWIYINGKSDIKTSETPSMTVTYAPEGELFYVILIFYSEFEGDFDYGISEENMIGITTSLITTFEFHFCPGELLFDERTLTCVEECTDGTILTGRTCSNPCLFSPPSSIPELNCYKMNIPTGPAIESPTPNDDMLTVQQVQLSDEYAYFAFRGQENCKYTKFAASSSYGFNCPISTLKKLSTVPPTSLEGTLSPYMLKNKITNVVYVWSARPDGYGVLTLPYTDDNKILIGYTSLESSNANGIRYYNLNDIKYGENGIYGDPEDYGSLVITQIIGLDTLNPDPELQCRLRVQHNGLVYVFVDGVFAGISSSIFAEDEAIFISEKIYSLNYEEFHLVQVYGISITQVKFDFTDCLLNDVPSKYDPLLLRYSPVEEMAEQSVNYETSKEITCPDNCHSLTGCDASGQCIRCQSNYCVQLSDGSCSHYKENIQSHTLTFETIVFCSSKVPNFYLLERSEDQITFNSPQYSILGNLVLTFTQGAKSPFDGLIYIEVLDQIHNIIDFNTQIQWAPTQAGINTLMVIQFFGFSGEDIYCYYQSFESEPTHEQLLSTPAIKERLPLTTSPDFWYFIKCYLMPSQPEQTVHINLVSKNIPRIFTNGNLEDNPDSGTQTLDVRSYESTYLMIFVEYQAEEGEFKIVTDGNTGFSGDVRTIFEYSVCPGMLIQNGKCVDACSSTSMQLGDQCYKTCENPDPALGCNFVKILNAQYHCGEGITLLASASNVEILGWNAVSNSTSIKPELIEHLQAQTDSIVYLPNYLITPLLYEFQLNFKSGSKDLTVSYLPEDFFPYISKLEIVGETQVDYATFQAEVEACFDYPLIYTWRLTGPTYSDELIISDDGKTVIIPRCSLAPNELFDLECTVWYDGYDYNRSSSITIESPMNLLSADMEDYMEFPAGVDIELYARYNSTCPVRTPIQYTWECNTYDSPACQFPDNTFGVTSDSNLLKIPKEYLTQESTFILSVHISNQDETYGRDITVKISALTTFDITITCPKCLEKFQPEKENYLLLEYQNPLPENSIIQCTLFPNIEFKRIGNLIWIPKIKNRNMYIGNTLNLIVNISSPTHMGIATFSMPINYGPKNGTFTITPSSGESMLTKFELSCPGWEDDDVPLTYQFVYDSDGSLITSPQSESSVSVRIKAKKSPQTKVKIRAVIMDSLGTPTYVVREISITKTASDPSGTMDKVNEIFNSNAFKDEDPITKIQTLSTIAGELDDLQTIDENPCPLCSGHGYCDNDGICVCSQRWTLKDCSMSNENFEKLIELKINILNNINETLNNMSNITDNSHREQTLEILKDLSNPDFSTNKTLELIKDILENSSLDIDNPNTILSQNETELVSTILDNLLDYVSTNDCKAETNLTNSIKDKLDEYMDTITRSSLVDKTINDNATIISRENFDIFVAKLTLCQIQSGQIQTGDNTPSIQLSTKEDSSDCESQEFNIQYLLFANNLFNCSNRGDSPPEKTQISLKITDPDTGDDVGSKFKMDVKMPPGNPCPSGCSSNAQQSCTCEDVSIFNIKQQILNIFKTSQISTLTNIDIFKDWKFYESFAFWTIIFMGFIYLASMIIISCWLATYCLLEKTRKKSKLKWRESLLVSFLVTFSIIRY